jgi:hypothetical protein
VLTAHSLLPQLGIVLFYISNNVLQSLFPKKFAKLSDFLKMWKCIKTMQEFNIALVFQYFQPILDFLCSLFSIFCGPNFKVPEEACIESKTVVKCSVIVTAARH